MQKLSHEKLDVYQKSIVFFTHVVEVIDGSSRGNSSILDQLKRAAQSIVLNIAEAGGYPTRAKSKHHFAIARGSALECGAALDVLSLTRVCDKKLIDQSKEALIPIVCMLSKLSQK